MSIVFAIPIIPQVFASTILYYSIKESFLMIISNSVRITVKRKDILHALVRDTGTHKETDKIQLTTSRLRLYCKTEFLSKTKRACLDELSLQYVLEDGLP